MVNLFSILQKPYHFSHFFQEFPCVRFRAAKENHESTSAALRDLIPTKLASAVWTCISNYKSALKGFPQTETCDLLILDRSIDQVKYIFGPFLILHCVWTAFYLCGLLEIDCSRYTRMDLRCHDSRFTGRRWKQIRT